MTATALASVSPDAAAPSDRIESSLSARPRVRLAAVTDAHQHAWQLRCVEYDAGAPVREFECATCTSVWYS